MSDDRTLEYLEYSVILTLFAVAVIGLLGMAGVPGVSELLLRVILLGSGLGSSGGGL
jgi:L-cystine uptake protein TcyP (sodium:dicarboxylate symporter family)